MRLNVPAMGGGGGREGRGLRLLSCSIGKRKGKSGVIVRCVQICHISFSFSIVFFLVIKISIIAC